MAERFYPSNQGQFSYHLSRLQYSESKQGLGGHWDVEETFGKIVSHLEHEYEKRTGVPPAIDASRQLPPNTQKLLAAMARD